MILLINYHYIKLEESNLFFDDNVDLDLGLVNKEGHIYNLEYEVIWKPERFFVTRPPTYWKSGSWFLFLLKENKRIKVNLWSNF